MEAPNKHSPGAFLPGVIDLPTVDQILVGSLACRPSGIQSPRRPKLRTSTKEFDEATGFSPKRLLTNPYTEPVDLGTLMPDLHRAP